MNVRLVIAGLNVVLVSAILSAYGLVSGESALLGLSASIGVIGATMVVYGVGYEEPSLEHVLVYLRALAEASSTVVETLDLLDGEVCGVPAGGGTLVVYAKSKAACTGAVNPGPGFTGSSPYFSIPVRLPLDIQPLEELSDKSIEEALSSVLVSEMGFCKSVRVIAAGDLFEVYVVGVSRFLGEFTGYPVSPTVILTVAALARVTGRGVVLVDKTAIPGGLKVVVKLV